MAGMVAAVTHLHRKRSRYRVEKFLVSLFGHSTTVVGKAPTRAVATIRRVVKRKCSIISAIAPPRTCAGARSVIRLMLVVDSSAHIAMRQQPAKTPGLFIGLSVAAEQTQIAASRDECGIVNRMARRHSGFGAGTSFVGSGDVGRTRSVAATKPASQSIPPRSSERRRAIAAKTGQVLKVFDRKRGNGEAMLIARNDERSGDHP